MSYETERNGGIFIGIVVADEGKGIPNESIEKIFDPFFTHGKKGGTGLGLAICKRIVSMHGGKIYATNRKSGRGAEFVIELPASETSCGIDDADLIHNSNELRSFREEEAVRREYGDSPNIAEIMRLHKDHGKPFYLLVVDDEPLFRETVRSLLNGIPQVRDHVRVVESGNAEEALNIFSARNFDYVIADIDMGRNRMNGYEMVEIILNTYPETNVLIHSNKRREEMDISMRKMNNERFMGFLPKPMKRSELLQFLARKSFEANNHTANDTTTETLKKNILILNDDDALLLTFKILLRSPNRHILTATNVQTALETLTMNRIDVILSDVNLGDGVPDGYEFLREVRKSNANIPVYVVSGYSESEEWPKAQKEGATGYLQLPVDKEQLLALLN